MPRLMGNSGDILLTFGVTLDKSELRHGFAEFLADTAVWEVRADKINIVRVQRKVYRKPGLVLAVVGQCNVFLREISAVFC